MWNCGLGRTLNALLLLALFSACVRSNPGRDTDPDTGADTSADTDTALVPTGEWRRVDAGHTHSCGITTSGRTLCWGTPSGGVPEGSFVEVAAGDSASCFLDALGAVACRNDEDLARAPNEVFTTISMGMSFACGQTDTDTVCWGEDSADDSDPSEYFDGATLVQVDAGLYSACGVTIGSAVRCEGDSGSGDLDAPSEDVYTRVSAGYWLACALDTDAMADCWGASSGDAPPAEPLADISVGWGFACGILASDGQLVCWGDGESNSGPGWEEWGLLSPPSGRYVDVSAGSHHACALGDDGAIACWGSDAYGQGTVPSTE